MFCNDIGTSDIDNSYDCYLASFYLVWQLSIAASYWLVNKSGLPLIFKQDGCQTPAAGQFEEHEIARCVAPLLFCFADKEKYELYVCVGYYIGLCVSLAYDFTHCEDYLYVDHFLSPYISVNDKCLKQTIIIIIIICKFIVRLLHTWA